MNANKTTYALIAIALLAGLLRLINVTQPLLGHHSWRQADTAAVARNFVEEQYNILHPKIDWRGTSTGDVECEFPIYQFVLASIYRIFGVHEAIGRLLSVSLSLLSLVGVYLISKRVANASVGLWASFFFAVLPMSIFFGRTVMPESLLLVACIYTALWFLKWKDTASWTFLLLSAAALSIACLLKPPTLYLGLPLAYLAIRKYGARSITRPQLWVFSAIVLGSLALWYIHAHQIKTSTGLTFGVWEYGSDKWGNWSLVGSWEFWNTIFVKRIPDVVLSYFGLLLLIIGFARPSHSPDERIFSLWLAGMLVFIIIVAKGVFVHDYYLLPATVPACYFIGKAVSWGLSKEWHHSQGTRISFVACVLGLLVVSFNNYGKWLEKEDPTHSDVFHVAQIAYRELPKDALVIAVDKGDPSMLYYAQKKGWRSFPADLTEKYVASLRAQGAKYIMGVHKDFVQDRAVDNLELLLTRHEVLINNNSFFIVKLGSKDLGSPTTPQLIQ